MFFVGCRFSFPWQPTTLWPRSDSIFYSANSRLCHHKISHGRLHLWNTNRSLIGLLFDHERGPDLLQCEFSKSCPIWSVLFGVRCHFFWSFQICKPRGNPTAQHPRTWTIRTSKKYFFVNLSDLIRSFFVNVYKIKTSKMTPLASQSDNATDRYIKTAWRLWVRRCKVVCFDPLFLIEYVIFKDEFNGATCLKRTHRNENENWKMKCVLKHQVGELTDLTRSFCTLNILAISSIMVPLLWESDN